MIVMIMLPILHTFMNKFNAKRDEVLGGPQASLHDRPSEAARWVACTACTAPAGRARQFKGHLGRDQAILGGHRDLTHQSQSSILAEKKQEVEVQSFDSKDDFLIGPLCSALKWKNQAELLFHEILYLKESLWLATWSFFISILNRESPAKNCLYT